MKKLIASSCIALLPLSAMAGDPTPSGNNDDDILVAVPAASSSAGLAGLGGLGGAGAILGLVLVGGAIAAAGGGGNDTSGTSGTN